jgi:ribosomal-protein-serine acetyltransferase
MGALAQRLVVDDRLVLELIDERHVAPGTAQIAASRVHLTPWMPWAVTSDEAAYRAYVTTVAASRAGDSATGGAAYAILVDGAFAGCIDLHDEVPGVRPPAIGYWLGEAFQGRGWMTRSVNALVAYAFRELGVARVELYADAANARSRAVAVRAGFLLCEIRCRRLADGREREEAVYERHAP